MDANDVYKILCDFIQNEFKHLRLKVDQLFYIVIGGLLTIIGGLITVLFLI